MSKRERETFAPRIIRTLGSQSLSGLNPFSSSNPSSLSQSPATSSTVPHVAANNTTMSPTPLNSNNMGTGTSVTSGADTPASASNYRVAQACDRCRSKKTRCDGKRPQCSQCAAVGFECKISDKLSRRAFPRGYTETLEERVRELEAENRRLVALCDLKEEQLHLVSKYSNKRTSEISENEDEQILQQLSAANGGSLRVSSTNLYLLHKTTPGDQQDEEDQMSSKTAVDCNGVGCNHSHQPNIHDKPVSTNLNDPTSISFEQNEAPGLPAVKALTSMANHEHSVQLATLVALSVPRSTEEILLIPQLLARIGQVHGLTSKQSLYTASLLASLKESIPLTLPTNVDMLKSTNLWEVDDVIQFFQTMFKFDIQAESSTTSQDHLIATEIDGLVSDFFSQWYNFIPILDKDEFYNYYNKFKTDLMDPNFFDDEKNLFNKRNKSISYKIFGCILLIICQMGLISKVKAENLPATNKYSQLMAYYDIVVRQLMMNPYFNLKSTSIQSLQFISLQLFYFLNIGEVSSVYDLRGKVVSMSQQLRLHRCPSAVLGGNGSAVSKAQQGERRILFWGIYYLDVFSALQLGVPRLLKDHEIECALPVADNDDQKVNLAGQMIALEGRVSMLSLSVIRFAKVLGNILDSIFKRGMSASLTKQISLVHENALDNWRRGLPQQLKFELDVNGTINMDEFNHLKQLDTSGNMYSKENKSLMVLYFMAKCMIHLPVVAKRPLVNDPEQSPESSTPSNNCGDRSSSSYVLLQQATNTLLNVFTSLRNVYPPIPINVSRTKTRFSLLSARGSLEYTKGGALFQDNKALLLDLVKELEVDKKLELPGTLSWHSLKLLDMSISLILQPANTKPEKLEKMLQRKLNYYNKLTNRRSNLGGGRSASSPGGSSKRKLDENQGSAEPPKLTPASSKGDTPPDKKIKLEDTGFVPVRTVSQHSQSDSEKFENFQPPVAPQNSIAEAFHLDPVLNNNPFSNADLNAFFNTNNGNVPAALRSGGSLFNIAATAAASGNNANNTAPSNTLNEGLFKVPSNGDFLKDYYNVPGASSSQLNLLFLNNNASNGKPQLNGSSAHPGTQAQNNDNNGFGFAVDASWGLAPLLEWSPVGKPVDPGTCNANENSIILDTSAANMESEMATGGRLHNNTRSYTDAKNLDIVPTLPSSKQQQQQQQQHRLQKGASQQPRSASIPTRKQSLCESNPTTATGSRDDGVLTMGTRNHRGPRRRWNSTTGQNTRTQLATMNTPQSERSKSQNIGESGSTEDSLHDLFRWQNSGL